MLRKVLLLLSVTLLGMNILHAQDTIHLKNGIVIYGLITEVNTKEIKFRVDGGSVSMEQVISYQKNGFSHTVQNTGVQVNQENTIKDCDRKNVGDAEIENKRDKGITVWVYAIGANPNDGNNPIVTEIFVPAKSSQPVYELTSGVHYVKYENKGNGSFQMINEIQQGTGQLKIIKCGVSKFVIN